MRGKSNYHSVFTPNRWKTKDKMNSEDIPRVSEIVSPYEDTTWYDDFSRERGNVVHRAIKAICKGLWVPSLKIHQGYVDSFHEWFDDMVEQVILVDPDKPLISRNFGFKGTPDFIGKIKSRGLSIPDWKTSASASKTMKKIWKLRLAGYKILAEENEFGPIESCFILMLDADGGRAKVVAEGELIDQAFFLRALDLYRYFE